MLVSGESQQEAIRPDFNRAIMIDFQGTTISSDTGFILLREVDDRFRIIEPMKDCLEDLRSPAHTKHALVQMVRQRKFMQGLVCMAGLFFKKVSFWIWLISLLLVAACITTQGD